MSEEIAIRVRGLVTRFGTQTVHDGLDLDVRRGEILGVVGPSGTGKSVLLREVVGLDAPTAGEITFPCFEEQEREPRLGVMFQDGALFSTLTILENVEAPLREHTRLSPELRSEIASLKLSMAGLGPDAHHKKPAQISGGMRKRASVARAIALDPELLFLDEPTAGLDPISAEKFDRMTEELARSLGLTVFLVTHDLDTLHAICDRVAVLYKGKVAAIGTIPEITANAEGWVKEYFSGPRGRAAQHGAAGG
ncbi:ABC transporter ATP-binding protein [Candidatus Viadribacter manganicus]|uniref:ABC transporter ATP-binding protein n=1 Tax=Candidatus Viadribacter manganicus TaxID=1759059 RepID=UPI001D171E5B|nr:ATP-binding cassette domain-containing protein [Candidatus Viadribacter manganicus]